MIGRELENKTELLELFLLQKNKKKGFSEVVYFGITTIKMAEIILIIFKEIQNYQVYIIFHQNYQN